MYIDMYHFILIFFFTVKKDIKCNDLSELDVTGINGEIW